LIYDKKSYPSNNQRNRTVKQYQHLTSEERFYIWNALREGATQKSVATALCRNPSTISREVRRNKFLRAKIYTYHWAKFIVSLRKGKYARLAGDRARKLTPEIEGKIDALICQYLSPEQVTGYLKRHENISISHETIYRYIYADKQRHNKLKPFLRQGKKLRRKRYGSGARVSKIPNRTCISERPKVVESKARIGDWECDSVIGLDRKSALITVVERKSLFTCCMRVFDHTAETVSNAIIEMLAPHIDKVKTLTFDNGSEFVGHEEISAALKAKSYFAHPYSSWERGANENTNGLIRQFYPKRADFRVLTQSEIRTMTDSLNNRPRKTRGYRSPNEIFNQQFVPLL